MVFAKVWIPVHVGAMACDKAGAESDRNADDEDPLTAVSPMIPVGFANPGIAGAPEMLEYGSRLLTSVDKLTGPHDGLPLALPWRTVVVVPCPLKSPLASMRVREPPRDTLPPFIVSEELTNSELVMLPFGSVGATPNIVAKLNVAVLLKTALELNVDTPEKVCAPVHRLVEPFRNVLIWATVSPTPFSD